MENLEFRFEPAACSVYQVQEDCCYTQVVFDGPKKGIYSRLDRENEQIGVLLCCICDSQREILQVSKDFYQTYYEMVKQIDARA